MHWLLEEKQMLKLYSDTDIYVDEENRTIILTRGYWNFIQVNIEYGDNKDKEKIISIFNGLLEKREINEEILENEYRENFEQLVKSGFVYKEEKNQETAKNRIVVITDIKERFSQKVKELELYESIEIEDTTDFIGEVLENRKMHEMKQDLLLKSKIKCNIEKFFEKYDMGVICLSRVNNELCEAVNYLVYEKELIYCILDKEFGYLFGTKMKYTGCYECFSKRMYAKMKTNRVNYKTKMLGATSNRIEKNYYLVMDLMCVLLLKNCKEYLGKR